LIYDALKTIPTQEKFTLELYILIKVNSSLLVIELIEKKPKTLGKEIDTQSKKYYSLAKKIKEKIIFLEDNLRR